MCTCGPSLARGRSRNQVKNIKSITEVQVVGQQLRFSPLFLFDFQLYLSLRHAHPGHNGLAPSEAEKTMSAIMAAVEKVRSFSERFREFMNDVTKAGLQKQYESVCENIGLIAFILQSEPSPGAMSPGAISSLFH